MHVAQEVAHLAQVPSVKYEPSAQPGVHLESLPNKKPNLHSEHVLALVHVVQPVIHYVQTYPLAKYEALHAF